ncbi:molybdenum cofactor biosynthesis protein MoaB [bacterium]|nr:molybdenum cofactor biosynthesis protein MoaB [bacterium]
MASEHHHQSDVRNIACGILTISDTRTEADDLSGKRIRALLEKEDHRVGLYRIVRDEPEQIVALLTGAPAEIEVMICHGGTGIARRDTTYEAIRGLLDKEITGFGELFRMLSWEQVGSAAMLSRATAGIAGQRAIFSLPGSSRAVELAMTKLILPELGHIVGLLR